MSTEDTKKGSELHRGNVHYSPDAPKTNRSGVACTVCAEPGCGHEGYYSDDRRNLCPAHWKIEAASIDKELGIAEADYLDGRS